MAGSTDTPVRGMRDATRLVGQSAREPVFCSVPSMKSVAAPPPVRRASFHAEGLSAIEGFGVSDNLVPGKARPALAIFEWVRSQGGIPGVRYVAQNAGARSATLPSYAGRTEEPGAEGDFLLGVAHGAIELLSIGGGDYAAELNPWYHSLNSGFKTRIARSAECIASASGGLDAGVMGRPIKLLDLSPTFVSEGAAQMLRWTVAGQEIANTDLNEIKLSSRGVVEMSTTMRVNLPSTTSLAAPSSGWSIESARIGTTDLVSVEVIANGKVIASKPMRADGSDQKLAFTIPVERSSWLAIRIMGAAHSNPVFVTVDSQPVRASRGSAEWSMRELARDFESKQASWPEADLPQARAAYDFAYAVYTKIMAESNQP